MTSFVAGPGEAEFCGCLVCGFTEIVTRAVFVLSVQENYRMVQTFSL